MNKTVNKDDIYTQISKLLLDENFRALKQQKKFNIFDVLKIARKEIRHSNVLAWLLDPSEDHGLGSRVLNEFVLLLVRDGHIHNAGAGKYLLAKYEEVTVYRERKNIDILIESVKDRFVICIENKIDTKDHSGQLNKYNKSVRQDYTDYQKVFVYLTPGGDQPTEETDSEWACLSYRNINICIDNAIRNAPIDKKVNDFIEYYQEILRREIMGEDAAIKRICSEVYRQHKAVLDLIYEYRPDDVQNFSDTVAAWCHDKEEKGEIFYQNYARNQSKRYCRFRDKVMDQIISAFIKRKVENKQSGWKGNNQYFYEIVLGTDSDGNVLYGLQLAFCSDSLNDAEKNGLSDIYRGITGNDAGQWGLWKTTALKSEKIAATDNALDDDLLVAEVWEKLDHQWEALKEKVFSFAKTLGLV